MQFVPGMPLSRRSCRNTFEEGYGCYREEILSSTVREIWLRLAEYWANSATQVISPRIRKMLNFLEQRAVQAISRQNRAKEFGLSPEHINALFKE